MPAKRQRKYGIVPPVPKGPDLYAELGLARNASLEDIKRAYRSLALQCHPDKCPGDEAANERFQRVSLAYSVLSDEHKRRYYDQTGTTEGLDISPDEFMDMFKTLLLEIIGGADMIRDMLSCFTPRELARLPPFPFPKELFPPGTFPPGLRFSSKGLKGMPMQVEELIQNGDLQSMFAAMSTPMAGSPPFGTKRARGGGARARSAGATASAPPPGRGRGPHTRGGSSDSEEYGDSGSDDSEWTDVSEDELQEMYQGNTNGGGVDAGDGGGDEGGGGGVSHHHGRGDDDGSGDAGSDRGSAGWAGLQQQEQQQKQKPWRDAVDGPAGSSGSSTDISDSDSGSETDADSPRHHPTPAHRRTQPPSPHPTLPDSAATPVCPAGSGGSPLPAPLIREWLLAARSCDVGALAGLLAREPALLGSRGAGMGHTALHWCAAKGCVEGVKWLLGQGLDVNVRNDDGATPLHAAARNGRLEAVEALLEWRTCQPPVAVREPAAPPASQAATEAGREAAAALHPHPHPCYPQPQRRCDVLALDGEGRTALQLALEFGHGEIAAALRTAVAAAAVEGTDPVAVPAVDAAGASTEALVEAEASAVEAVKAAAEPEAKGAETAAETPSDMSRASATQGSGAAPAVETAAGAAGAAGGAAENQSTQLDVEAAMVGSPVVGAPAPASSQAGGLSADPAVAPTESPAYKEEEEKAARAAAAGEQRCCHKDDGVSCPAAGHEVVAEGGAAGPTHFDRQETPLLPPPPPPPPEAPSPPPPPPPPHPEQGKGMPSVAKGCGSSGQQGLERRPGGLTPEEKAARRAALLAADEAAEREAERREAEKTAAAEAAALAAGLRSREEGRTWLEAARRGDLPALQRMLAANPRLLGYQGQGTNFAFTSHTALHWAVAKGHTAVARWLLEQGADPDVPNAAGATPLHAAASQGADQCARLLVVEAAAKMGVADALGETVRDILLRRDAAAEGSSGSGGGGGTRLASELELLARVAALRDAPGEEAEWTPRVMRGTLVAAGVNVAGLLERRELVEACRQLIARHPPRIRVLAPATATAAAPAAAAAGVTTAAGRAAQPPQEAAGSAGAAAESPPPSAEAEQKQQQRPDRTSGGEKATTTAASPAAASPAAASGGASGGSGGEAAAAAAAADSARQRGNEAYSRGDYPKAVSHYTMALRLAAALPGAPGVAVLHSNRCAAYCGMSYFGKAQADAEEAVRLEPSQPKYRCRLGAALLGQRQWREAEAAFRAALALDPAYAAAVQGLADVRAAVGGGSGSSS